MAKETRIYMINIDLIDDIIGADDLSNNEFMDEAEKQGFVYTIKGFQNAFNDINATGEVDTSSCFIRILEV